MIKRIFQIYKRLFKLNSKKTTNSNAYREFFRNTIDLNLKTLEIGPFVNPMISGCNVEYFDVLSTEELLLRAKKIGLESKTPQNINYVDANGDLSVIKKKYKQVVSSHLIEHQPCLVAHLINVERLLEKKGKYFLITPDKRYCFDHFIPESTIADVLQAFHEKRRIHTLSSVIEHRALTCHNDPVRHWENNHDAESYQNTQCILERTKGAIEEYNQANGGYIDVHAWQFTPDSFRAIMQYLYNLGLIRLKVKEVQQTPYGRNEFTAILSKD